MVRPGHENQGESGTSIQLNLVFVPERSATKCHLLIKVLNELPFRSIPPLLSSRAVTLASNSTSVICRPGYIFFLRYCERNYLVGERM